jgi:hypothetical protein
MEVDAVGREDERRQLGDRVVAFVNDDDRRVVVRLVAPAVQAGAFQLRGRGHRVELRRGEEFSPLRELIGAQAALLGEVFDRGAVAAAGVVLVFPRCGEVFVGLRQHRARHLRVVRVERRFDLAFERCQTCFVGFALRQLLLAHERGTKRDRAAALGADVGEDVRGIEDPGEAVVVLRGDGVELMVVAARARNGQAHEGAAGEVDLVVDNVADEFFLVRVAAAPFADHVDAGGDDAVLVEGAAVARGNQVTGDLFLDEAVVGQVVVKTANDPVAVAPGEGAILLLADDARVEGVGVADDVEPVTGPALAVLRGSQKFVDEFCVGVGAVVFDEGFDFIARRREAEEVEVGAADERAAVGGGGGREILLFEFSQDEAIDRILRPRGVLHDGRRVVDRFLKRPPLATFIQLRPQGRGGGRMCCGDGFGHGDARIGRAHLHPRFEVRDLRIGQLLVRRHLEFFVLVTDGLDQPALVGIAEDNAGPGVAALEQAGARVEQQVRLQLVGFRAVALVAALDEERADYFLEELDAGGIGKRLGACGTGRTGEEQRDGEDRLYTTRHGITTTRDAGG